MRNEQEWQTHRGGVGLIGHAGAVAFFFGLAIAWTWPLARHISDRLPGAPGDNFSFVWNLWWMRFVLAHPNLPYFHTDYLFFPFGTTIADHPHTALPALVAATALRRVSLVSAQNLLLLGYVFLNLVVSYALAWSVTRRPLPSAVAAVIFGLAPYMSVHLLGHFDLVAAWPLPLYALLLRRAYDRPSRASALAAGVILAATAYTAYYYVVYLAIFSIAFLAVRSSMIVAVAPEAPPSQGLRRTRNAAAIAACVFAAIGVAIIGTGGWTWSVGRVVVSARSPQNALTMMWVAVALWALTIWRRRVRIALGSDEARRVVVILLSVGVVFVVLASPLLWQAAQLVLRHEYVTPDYQWRSAPRGVDLLAPFLGHPLHPVFGALSRSGYKALGLNFVEGIGWFGVVVPLVLVATRRVPAALSSEVRAWRAVAVVFAIWALGPFVVIGGFDTGLKLPAILLRYVPFVANARMPGRAIVMVYLAISIVVACGLATTDRRWRTPILQVSLLTLIAFEYWQAPINLTSVASSPVYAILAASPPGPVCEVPFGIGDGLGAGGGSQDRRVLLDATRHEHPLVGGFIGRMPSDAVKRYRQTPVVMTLLALSGGEPPPPAADSDPNVRGQVCSYLVVHRSKASPALLTYIDALALQPLASSGEDHLFKFR